MTDYSNGWELLAFQREFMRSITSMNEAIIGETRAMMKIIQGASEIAEEDVSVSPQYRNSCQKK